VPGALPVVGMRQGNESASVEIDGAIDLFRQAPEANRNGAQPLTARMRPLALVGPGAG
jgi:hypothetical protein